VHMRKLGSGSTESRGQRAHSNEKPKSPTQGNQQRIDSDPSLKITIKMPGGDSTFQG
jgi:hypothetical protein